MNKLTQILSDITIFEKYAKFNDLKYFLEFLNPTHKFDYIQEDGLTTRFYLFDFIGRIFVGYGIYQFIQAFRKYK
jgi:hypothetical protein